ncbi:hypothetical protein ASPWEDRAFT_518357 [Aspergillus wentii DTO 134E9]|uniref:Ketoreductase domain-containing protein n=1 Tax=Aspergillus wentii DTO 134E9 TaxID=1073089 RepID=A0A1L9RL19_ASPWE|nr:uncharacterized protein ASPWEDRAFT_518357 [Aspergillus wentii DTO 134E9]KAI9924606.1 hypothetical protein MW887_006879 [Aspergillus wentii]OJJ35630.1 hypothetical protein ASPWEDRAFT_518357 [Aspergillus wentii DTO 134E9]
MGLAQYLVYLLHSAESSADSSARSQDLFCGLNSQGCTVNLVTGTVADIADVRIAVDCRPRPISGVLHLSMVLQDRALLQMTLEDWKAATMPKVTGTWNLHHVFEHHQLDFFLLFSSLVGHQGYSCQANYAAGSTFLDAFAQYRRSLGLLLM